MQAKGQQTKIEQKNVQENMQANWLTANKQAYNK